MELSCLPIYMSEGLVSEGREDVPNLEASYSSSNLG